MACEAGIDSVQYWDMTYKEIKAAINGYAKRSETDMRINAVIAYQQARLIAHQVGIMFGGKEEQKQIYEAFPGMFPHLEQQAAIQNKRQQDWQIMKARIDAYAAEKRKQREVNKENGDDVRGTTDTNNDGNP